MSKDLIVHADISSNAQFVQDQDGNTSALSLSDARLGAGTESPNAPITAQSPGKNVMGITLLDSTNKKTIADFHEGSNGHGNVALYDNKGTRNVQLSAGTGANYVQGKFGIGTNAPSVPLDVRGEIKGASLTITSGGDIVLSGIPAASKAPGGANLEVLLIDTKTGKLYFQ